MHLVYAKVTNAFFFQKKINKVEYNILVYVGFADDIILVSWSLEELQEY